MILELECNWILIFLGIDLILTAVFCLIFSKTVKLFCTTKIFAISLAISAVGTTGLVCFLRWLVIVGFGEMSRFPIEYPFSIICGLLSLLLFIFLVLLYIKYRKQKWSVKGILTDISAAIIYMPVFYAIIMWIWSLLNYDSY